jgi:undecaprenyl diphosphate synthase
MLAICMHIGIIMDGNRRWAKSRHLPSFLGHIQGAKNIEQIVDYASEKGADIITLYAMSTENFVNRSKEEVEKLTQLIAEYAISMSEKLIRKSVRTIILGNLATLPVETRTALENLMESTKSGTKTVLQVCINYGGRDEIVRGVKSLIDKGQEITEENISSVLDSPTDIDLIIRTGGNKRLSNFLTWQSAYSELYFTETLWPDFGIKEYQKALDYFFQENRNFGK